MMISSHSTEIKVSNFLINISIAIFSLLLKWWIKILFVFERHTLSVRHISIITQVNVCTNNFDCKIYLLSLYNFCFSMKYIKFFVIYWKYQKIVSTFLFKYSYHLVMIEWRPYNFIRFQMFCTYIGFGLQRDKNSSKSFL